MDSSTINAPDRLDVVGRSVSVAVIGKPTRPTAYVDSRFFHGVRHAGEDTLFWEGKPMFPLLQIRVDELPFVPVQLRHIAVLVLYMNLQSYPFGQPHGQGWAIREYACAEGLSAVHNVLSPDHSYPIHWRKAHEGADAFQSQTAGRPCDGAAGHCTGTKVGGYPSEILRTSRLDEFVFQIASESLINWKWAENGVGLFFRSAQGEWRWSCAF
ncbi:hypothetical protein [Pseudomonas sp. B11(2017)]|uniref:hypothetical protein n=1 Tax=Pseudomonas sp. B11(2017) TaxID=1981748 RepID=UPI00111C4D41|nr:hypothetical protein [Pseudomonas sp. B11(2017)]